MRVIICGGRDFTDQTRAYKWLDLINDNRPITHVIEGGARGADRIGREWAISRRIPYTTVNAEWDKYGKSAGYKRNKRMRDEFQPDAVLALPGGVGTRMMIDLAKQINLLVLEAKV